MGLAEKHRDALRSFIETNHRVTSLEKQNTVMWAVIGGLIVALLAVVMALVAGS